MESEIRGKCKVCGHRASSVCPSCQEPVCSMHMVASNWDLVEQAGDKADAMLEKVGGSEACVSCFGALFPPRRRANVPIFRDTDPKKIRRLVAALRAEDFDARGVGLESAALLGEGQETFAVWVEVPPEQQEAAKRFLAGFFELPEVESFEFEAEPPD